MDINKSGIKYINTIDNIIQIFKIMYYSFNEEVGMILREF